MSTDTRVSLTLLNEVYTHLHLRGVKYGFGSKAPSLDCDTSKIDRIDCSGFTRYVLAKATAQRLIIPDGSVNQHDWAKEHLQECPYGPTTVGIAISPRLYIAFLSPRGGHPGHVWLVRQAYTRESHGSVGVDARPWDTPVLAENVDGCYILPSRP
ncbi:MAG: C40 family peptidase [Actinomycetota bacterium]|nr:C40 family peptidase [Actinomycetota bacterium]